MQTGYLLELHHTDGSISPECIHPSKSEAESIGKYYMADKSLEVSYYTVTETGYFHYGQDQY